MSAGPSFEEIDQLLVAAGWHPARDMSDRVPELTAFVISDLAAHDCRLELFPEANAFLRSYGFLTVEFPYDADRMDRFITCARFCSDKAEEISELMDDLQQSVFPVGWDKVENGLVVMAPDERMFYLHHSGTYYAGMGIHEVISSLRTGRLQQVERAQGGGGFGARHVRL
ncbi:SUKH-3 domain-containing protein [Streptomyces sp. NPDC021749]|uniref:SUKH-3 domain-containing protein n=1 Tax=Streptomyces sp. NPDC021749 TaxID=3154905 RepID=UPI0033E074D2